MDFIRERHHFHLVGLIMLAFFLSACSGGSGGSASQQAPIAQAPEEEEIVYIGLTDAEGDFLEYSTEVVSVKLVRENGTIVETLPLSTTVDFAQYTELTEFLTAASVPVGVYVSASIVLNYSNASVQIEDANGDPVAAEVIDENGQHVTQVELGVEFGDRDRFRILPGVPAHITLDFDLESSHTVDLTASPVTAQLTGVLLADTLLESPKQRRARGLLGNVDVGNNVFQLRLRPFYRADGSFGSLRVLVNDATSYEINGESYEGAAGLQAMELLPENTYVVTLGELDIGPRTYTAEVVRAGSSVPFGDKDIVTGTVIARLDNTLTLKGAVIVQRDYSVHRVAQLNVAIDSATPVTQVKSAFARLGAADISVGQRITAVGDLHNPANGERELDAANGQVRVLFTQLHALVKEASPLVLDLARINHVVPAKYDFAGTGIGADQDADPDHYEVDTGVLTLDGIDINDAVKVRGFVQPFGTAPVDFLAQTLGDVSQVPGMSRVRWSQNAGLSALTGVDEQALVLDISDSTRAVHWYSGAIVADMTEPELAWTIRPPQNGRGVFAIITRDSRQVFTHFGEFGDALLSQLNAGGSMRFVRTRDTLDIDSMISDARRIVVIIGGD